MDDAANLTRAKARTKRMSVVEPGAIVVFAALWRPADNDYYYHITPVKTSCWAPGQELVGEGVVVGELAIAAVPSAVARAGLDPTGYSAHSLRAGFVNYAHLRGASDRAIAHQTRHRSLATLGAYVRVHSACTDNAATVLGF